MIKINYPIQNAVLVALLFILSLGLVYADSSQWIFCSSFESPSVSCSSNSGLIKPEEGEAGNLWNQMHWGQGHWE